MGKWKGIRTGVKKNPQAAVALYDLESDPTETKDVAGGGLIVAARPDEAAPAD